jgi:hypothetical protein
MFFKLYRTGNLSATFAVCPIIYTDPILPTNPQVDGGSQAVVSA